MRAVFAQILNGLRWGVGQIMAMPRWLKIVCALLIVAGIVYAKWGWVANVIEPTPKQQAIIFIGGKKAATRRGDIVFVHGLNGSAWETWGDRNASFFWPRWLHEQLPDVGVWSLDYDAAPSKWLGNAMPVEDRAENLLDQMDLAGIGKKPIIFVCHSLGGIVAIKMIEKGSTLSHPPYVSIAKQTKGIAFLATPHTGSDKAELLKLADLFGIVRTTELVDQLESNASMLRSLNTWYRDNAPRLKIATRVLYEKYDVPGVGRIVTESSSNPGITNVFPTPVDANHLTICKPDSAEDHVCMAVSKFIADYLRPPPEPIPTTLAAFLEQFKVARNNTGDLETLKKLHERKQFTWDGYVREVFPPTGPQSEPAYVISLSTTTKSGEWVTASFLTDGNFDVTVRKGTKVRISGVLSTKTTKAGIILRECTLVERLEAPGD